MGRQGCIRFDVTDHVCLAVLRLRISAARAGRHARAPRIPPKKRPSVAVVRWRRGRVGKGQMGSARMGSLQISFFLTEGLFGYSR